MPELTNPVVKRYASCLASVSFRIGRDKTVKLKIKQLKKKKKRTVKLSCPQRGEFISQVIFGNVWRNYFWIFLLEDPHLAVFGGSSCFCSGGCILFEPGGSNPGHLHAKHVPQLIDYSPISGDILFFWGGARPG